MYLQRYSFIFIQPNVFVDFFLSHIQYGHLSWSISIKVKSQLGFVKKQKQHWLAPHIPFFISIFAGKPKPAT